MHYGEQTRAAINNFGGGQLPRDFIRALAEVKLAALNSAYEQIGYDPEILDEISSCLNEIIRGDHDNQFPLSLHQGGAGTSLHMNILEVLSSLLSTRYGRKEYKDFFSSLNPFQSTNDVIPTAVTVMAYRHLSEIEEHTIKLQELLVDKEQNYGQLLVTGRTQLQDALPMSFGQIFGSWAGAVQRDRWRLHKLKDRLRTIPLGGTALGTCFSAPSTYIFSAEKHLRNITGLPLCRSQNLPDEIAFEDKYSELASGYRLLAENLFKISSDLLLYSSSLSGEIIHPDVQIGSTIMAAKTNPVLLEAVRGLSLSVQGEAHKISLYSQTGQLQLNPNLPFLCRSLLDIHQQLDRSMIILNEQFLPGMRFNYERISSLLLASPALINALLPLIDYKKLKDIYQKHFQNGNFSTLEDAADIIAAESEYSKEQIVNQITQSIYMKKEI